MADDGLGERFEELVTHVIAPLVLGGPVHLVRPFGPTIAKKLGQGRTLADLDLRTRLDVARVRQARLLAPVDTLRELDPPSIALAAALNDLLQASNHELAGPLTRGRHRRLLASVAALCARIPAPRDIASALARHATFARVLECVRKDSVVAWWTGSAKFRGQPAPTRLTAWPGLRQVRIDEKRVRLAEMATGLGAVSEDEFHATLGLWLTRSPLTDLATATRKAPRFGWSASTLALIAVQPGRSLAFRAIARQRPEVAAAVLADAANVLPVTLGVARKLAESFASEIAAGRKLEASSR